MKELNIEKHQNDVIWSRSDIFMNTTASVIARSKMTAKV